jgi:predicted component of type VI protein secretion system
MRFRLRYLHHDLDLSEGQLTVGRSSACQLFLDDPLVSRRHAIFFVTDKIVSVEDQLSRNGVLVNGERISGRAELQIGDKILIGSQELTLLAASAASSAVDPNLARKTLSRVPTQDEEGGFQAPAVIERGPIQIANLTGSELDSDPSAVRRINAFKLLSGVAEKALALGRAEEAERLLSAPLVELVEASRAGHQLSPSLVDTVTRFAAKLAAVTGKASWADLVIELYHAQGRPCAAPVIDELNAAVRRVSALDVVALRAYLALLREKQATFGPAERFLLQRLEGLERLAALR